jgi:hypothetical protein
VAGSGGVSIQTEDGGLSFARKASLTFWDLTSKLTIDGVAYALVGNVKSTNYWVRTPVALARDDDASSYQFPLYVDARGHLEGLGHTISNKTFDEGFASTSSGILSNLRLTKATVQGDASAVAIAVAENSGIIDHVSVQGTFEGRPDFIGGVAGFNTGVIRNSSAAVNIPIGAYFTTGGLVGSNGTGGSYGSISNSWATGTIHIGITAQPHGGGLVGSNCGTIQNSYSLAKTRYVPEYGHYDYAHGGLVGNNYSCGSTVTTSYTAGATAPAFPLGSAIRPNRFAGGVVGYDVPDSTFRSVYWATDSGRHNPKQAAGNRQNEPGMTGLTEAQLKSALPAGFDPKIWAQSPDINNGFPYLLSNPPQ